MYYCNNCKTSKRFHKEIEGHSWGSCSYTEDWSRTNEIDENGEIQEEGDKNFGDIDYDDYEVSDSEEDDETITCFECNSVDVDDLTEEEYNAIMKPTSLKEMIT